MPTIEDRCSRLETSLRRHRAISAGALVLGCVLLAGGAGQPDATPELVRARALEVVAPTGERVALLGYNTELRCGEITTFGADGVKKVWVGGEPAQSNGCVVVHGKTGQALAGLYADDNTGCGAVAIQNGAGKQIHYVSGDKDGNASMVALNASGHPIQRLSCTPKGAGWLSVRGADGAPLVQLGGANADGNGVVMVGRANKKPAAEIKGWQGLGQLTLFDEAGRIRIRVGATDEHGGRVGVVTADGSTWSWWPPAPESASNTGPVTDRMDEILRGLR